MTKRWISVSGEGEATVAPDMAVVTPTEVAAGELTVRRSIRACFRIS